MKKPVRSLWGLLVVAAAFMLPSVAHATTVTAVLCSVNVYPCPAAFILDAGTRSYGPALLGANQYVILPFNFNDAISNFSGTIMATDSRGQFTYLWGGGIGTDKTGAAMWLDVAISQTFLTIPGPAAYSEFNRGGCNASATLDGSFVQTTAAVNGNPFALPVLTGNCGAFNVKGGPSFGVIGAATNLTDLAQFDFLPGLPNEQINLPFGEDDPDPNLNFTDPNDPENVPTPNDIPAGFTNAAPEPASLFLVGSGLFGVGVLRRHQRKRAE